MAVAWGSWDTNIRVGIDIVVTSSSDISITYRIDFYIESRYTISDSMVMAISGSSGSDSVSFNLSNSGGGTLKVASKTLTRTKVYGGGPSLAWGCSITGHFDGGTPIYTRSTTVPARPADAPNAPGTPSVSSITGTKANLAWSVPGTNGAGITGYQLQLSTSSSFSSNAHNSPYATSGASINFTSGLTPGQTYYARARANSSEGYGPWSGTRSWTQLDTPGKVALPTTSDITHNSADLDWTAPSTGGAAISGYDIQIATNSSFSGASSYTRTTRTISFTSLAKGTTYFTRVRATNSVGDGDWSSTRSFTTNDVPNQVSTPTSSLPSPVDVRFAWTAPNNGGSAITGYDIQLSKSSTFTTIEQTVSTTSLNYTFADLEQAVTYYGRVRAKNAAGVGEYSAGRSATTYYEDLTTYPTPAPTLTLVAGSSSHRALFRVQAAEAHPFNIGTLKFGYELSKSETFTSPISGEANLDPRTLVGAQTGETMSFTSDLQMGFAVTLPTQGAWYLRVRVGGDNDLPWSPWTEGQFTSAHIPASTVAAPSSDQKMLYSEVFAFSFNVTDASPNEPITAYQIQLEDNATGTVLVDTGKTTETLKKGLNVVSVSIATVPKDVSLRWKVKVWDSTDVESPWSPYSLFWLVDAPVVTITTPEDAGTVTTGAPTVTWDVTLTSGRVQSSAVVRVLDDGGNQVWQRTVTGTAKTVTPSTPILVNGQPYTVTVTVVDSSGLAGSSSSSFETAYVSPSPLAYNVIDKIATEGFIEVDWSDVPSDPRLVAWRLYRREMPDGEWTLLTEIRDETVRNYRDYLVQSGKTYMYNVTQVADRSGELLEGPVGTMISDGEETQAEYRIFRITVDQYWLIVPRQPAYSMALPNVTDAPESDEYEDSILNVIGRGRHYDYGDEIGYKGSITFQIRQPEISSSVRTAFEELRRLRETYYLRTPFGRLYQVAIGNPDWKPLAGSGPMEMGDMSFEWLEVK